MMRTQTTAPGCWDNGAMSIIGIFETPDGATVGLQFMIDAAVPVVIEVLGKRYRVIGWDEQRQAFECELIESRREG